MRKSKSATLPKAAAEPRLSRTRRPETLLVADWQAALRRQFGREQSFALRNLGAEPVFSTFRVDNPVSGTHYLVTIRGLAPGHNQCTCWDYATNHLGTCKHIEFTLARLQARRGCKAALARGLAPAHSEIRLDYLGARQLRLCPGTACPPKFLKQASQSFDPAAGWALPWSRLDDVGTLARAAQAAGHELLGDEMGLGKTVQAIAAAELMARHFGVQRVLVVCPTSLKHQWKAEFAKFAGRPAQVIHGCERLSGAAPIWLSERGSGHED